MTHDRGLIFLRCNDVNVSIKVSSLFKDSTYFAVASDVSGAIAPYRFWRDLLNNLTA